MNSVTIRKATVDDADAIKQIIKIAFKKYVQDAGISANIDALNETIEQIKEDILNNEVFVAFKNDIPVGTIRVELLPDKTSYISRFGVLPDYHNIGIGKALMILVDEFNISKGVKSVSLHTASKNKELLRFYSGMGYLVGSTTSNRGYSRDLMVKEYQPFPKGST